ncbi:uncharacterized protein LTR77_008128 [Saxophila tyrrhenica]|uniref:Uncharacterized protein n=1 Tax=Saxophila tyrrhenica TaxID=1690608 RepID=A0AAV9P3V9_9PEZI|nr:hypothetical protein LTR77_008128 [Saxophila tyrrhenica]
MVGPTTHLEELSAPIVFARPEMTDVASAVAYHRSCIAEIRDLRKIQKQGSVNKVSKRTAEEATTSSATVARPASPPPRRQHRAQRRLRGLDSRAQHSPCYEQATQLLSLAVVASTPHRFGRRGTSTTIDGMTSRAPRRSSRHHIRGQRQRNNAQTLENELALAREAHREHEQTVLDLENEAEQHERGNASLRADLEKEKKGATLRWELLLSQKRQIEEPLAKTSELEEESKQYRSTIAGLEKEKGRQKLALDGVKEASE